MAYIWECLSCSDGLLRHITVLGGLSGVVAFHLLPRATEWHYSTRGALLAYILLEMIGIKYPLSIGWSEAKHALRSHLMAILAYTLFYRLYLDPLSSIPGPFLAKFSKLWHVFQCLESRNHLLLEGLNSRYGDFVRTGLGPNEITVFDPEGLDAVSQGASVEKEEFYNYLHSRYSFPDIHEQKIRCGKRKGWESALAGDALKKHQARIRVYASRIRRAIEAICREPVDMSSAIHKFAYQAMCDFAFGEVQDENDESWWIAMVFIRNGLAILGPLSQAPWLARVSLAPGWLRRLTRGQTSPAKTWKQMIDFCTSKMSLRMSTVAIQAGGHDIAAGLIRHAKESNKLDSREQTQCLNGDAVSLVIDGSCKVASTAIFAIWYLALDGRLQEAIHKEITIRMMEAGHTSLDELTSADLGELAFLNGVVNETLRLHHPLPTAGRRVVREPGLRVGGRFVPAGVALVAPRWSYGRHQAHFRNAREFLPERWLGNPKLVYARGNFTPWGVGSWSCLGKDIALFELRYLLCWLVHNYEFTFPADEDRFRVIRDMKDQIIARPGQLDLSLTPRE